MPLSLPSSPVRPANLPLSGPALARFMQSVQTGVQQRLVQAQPRERIYVEYQDRPVEFIREILGVKVIPDDIAEVAESLRSSPVTIARSGNGTGKTYIGAHLAVWWLLCFPDCQIYTAAAPPEENLKNLLWGQIGKIVTDKPGLFAGYGKVSLAGLRVERSPTEFLTGVTIPASGDSANRIARFSGKHAPNLLFIVDEGDAVPDEVYTGIESCMSGGHARLLVLFNPRAKIGPVWRKERDKQANVVELTAFDHPNVITGQNLVPGAVDRETTVRRISEWSRALAPGEEADPQCFEVPDFLVGCTAKSQDGLTEYPPLPAGTRKITEQALNYMVLARYPAQGSRQLISEEDIARARARWDVYVAQNGEKPPVGVKGKLGQDVAELGEDANAACLRYGGWVPRFKTWGGVDIEATSDRVAEMYVALDLDYAFIDGTGVGAGVPPSVIRKVRRAKPAASVRKIVSVKVASAPTTQTELGEFALLRDQLWWAVRNWLEKDPGAMLPPDEELIEELLAAQYDVVGKYVKVTAKPEMRKRLGRSPDRADSLCLTFAPENKAFKIEFA